VSPIVVKAPLSGIIVPLEDVPDPDFADILVGPGVAIIPGFYQQPVLAPISGRLLKLKPHAFVIADGRRAVLVHLGIDTVRLNGAASTLLVTEKQMIRAGDPVMLWDPSAVTMAGLSAICPVVALDALPGAVATVTSGKVTAGGDLFTWQEPAHA
jgi:PTS system glucose-specific IIA component